MSWCEYMKLEVEVSYVNASPREVLQTIHKALIYEYGGSGVSMRTITARGYTNEDFCIDPRNRPWYWSLQRRWREWLHG